MGVDYKGIADADPGGTLEDAFKYMSEDIKVQSRGEYRVTQLIMARDLGMTLATSIRAKLDTAVVAGGVPGWLIGFLDGPGIDINDPETAIFMTQLVAGKILNKSEADALLGMRTETVLVWSGLKIGHLDNSRQGRR